MWKGFLFLGEKNKNALFKKKFSLHGCCLIAMSKAKNQHALHCSEAYPSDLFDVFVSN